MLCFSRAASPGETKIELVGRCVWGAVGSTGRQGRQRLQAEFISLRAAGF